MHRAHGAEEPARGSRGRAGWTSKGDRFSGAATGGVCVDRGGGALARERGDGDVAGGGPAGAGGERNEDGNGESGSGRGGAAGHGAEAGPAKDARLRSTGTRIAVGTSPMHDTNR